MVTHPALDQVSAIAAALGNLSDRVVFIGGAIAPLLQTRPPFPQARVTSDVDGVVATSTYSESQRFQEALGQHGFQQSVGDPMHAHRWIAPNGIPFDIVPAGSHLGGSGNPWDVIAIETAVRATLAGGVTIQHASAPAFLAQKWAAHNDRGADDPLASHDLEDILALLASRPSIADELGDAPQELRAYVAEQSRLFLADADASDLLAAHLNNAQDAVHVVEEVRQLLKHCARE